MTQTNRVCKNCKMYTPTKPGQPGNCHAMPPHVVVVPIQDMLSGQPQLSLQGVFPPVDGETSFCGLHDPIMREVNNS